MRTFLSSVISVALLRPASATPPPVRLEPCGQATQSPTTITHAGDGSRAAVYHRATRVHPGGQGRRSCSRGSSRDLSALLVPERAGYDERGLLGLAFHPDYENAARPGFRRFYVFYSTVSPNAPGSAAAPVNCRSVVAEYQVSAGNPAVADPLSARILLAFDKPQFNHNGGQLAFGPDGLLYIGTGDGGSSNDNDAGHTGGSAARPANALGNAQDLTRLLGKILRIDPLGTNGPGGAYGIPAGNPYAASPNGERPEIFAFGLRNPWRFSFDDGTGGTGRLFAADVGQGSVEEVDLVTAGGNYGWRNFEGTFAPSFSAGAPVPTVTPTPPIAQYAHPGVTLGSPALPQIGVSITGGFVYRGAAIPGLQGVYVFADWSQNGVNPLGVLMGLEEGVGSWSLSTLNVEGGNPVPWFIQALGVDEAGEIYVAGKLTRSVSELSGGLPAGALLKLMHAPPPQTVALPPAQDNTMYYESDNSNAVGPHLFAGVNANFHPRRALLRFDLSALPASITVQAASLRLVMNQGPTAAHDFRLHRVLESWGEGTSDAGTPGGTGAAPTSGDATWHHRFYSATTWSAAGGSFAATASATTQVTNATGAYTWSATPMVNDVRAWLDNPSTNFGWILRGADEAQSFTAKRFSSRENATAADRPALSVTYQVVPPPPTRRQAWERAYFYRGQYVDDLADLEGDRAPNLLEYAFDQSPMAVNSPEETLWVAGDVVHFLRDPRAVDLTYRLQAGTAPDNLGTTLVTSAAGAAAAGTGLLGETVSATHPPLVEVTVRMTVPALVYARLSVQRN
ncbi:MAG: PQQ-dependent sugar dehydrogenase [Kiritimatiellia bacterium]